MSLYRADRLTDKAVIVESSKDAEALGDWPATGAPAWTSTSALELAALGVRTAVVITGADKAAARAEAVAATCLAAGVAVRVVTLDEWGPAAWIERHDLAGLAALCREAPLRRPEEGGGRAPDPPAAGADAQAGATAAAQPAPPPTPPKREDDIARNRHYHVLGLAGDSVAIRIAAGRVLIRSRESLCSPATLVSLAPIAWWIAVAQVDSLGATVARGIGDGLIRAADTIGPVDLSTIQSRGAVRTPAGVVWHLGDRLLVDGAEVGLDDAPGEWLSEPPIDLPAPATRERIGALRDALMAYRWVSPEHGRRFLGWTACAVAAGALDWRPHMLLHAPAGTGKSWLLRHALGPLFGPLAQQIADATPAALARYVGGAAFPVILDEAEPTSAWLEGILALLRIASGADGLRLRAAQGSGGTVSQAHRFSALLAATAVPRLNAADESRLSLVALGGEVDDWPAVEGAIIGAMRHAPAIRGALIRATPDIVEAAARAAREARVGLDTRAALTAGALTAGWWWWAGHERDIVTGRDLDAQDRTPTGADAAAAVQDILALTMRLERGGDQSVGALLRQPDGPHEQIADLYGVRRVNGDLLVAARHHGLRAALRRTDLGPVDLGRLLAQIEGAGRTAHQRRFGPHRERAVVVPEGALAEMDIDITPEQPELPEGGGE